MIVRCLLLWTLAAAASLLPPSSVQAATFSVSPLRVDLSSQLQTGALTIRNQQDAEVTVEAQAMLWEQVDGQDRLTPTRDVLVSPVVFTLAPNGSQLVRVALQRPADAQRELSYRLILTEVPPTAERGFTGLSVTLRMSLPIFVAATTDAQPTLEWTATRVGADRLEITARNTGGAHTRVLNLIAEPVGHPDAAIAERPAAYVLPGQAWTWNLDIKPQDGTSGFDWRQISVKGTTEAGDFAAELGSDIR